MRSPLSRCALLTLALLMGCEDKSTAVVLKIRSAAAVDCIFVTLESGGVKIKESEIDLRKPPYSDGDWLRPYELDGLSRQLALPVLVYSSGAFKGNQFMASAYGRLG